MSRLKLMICLGFALTAAAVLANSAAPKEDVSGDSFGFATWNIGHFSLGRSMVSAISPADGKARAADYLSFFRSLRVDVIGLSEFSPLFTTD